MNKMIANRYMIVKHIGSGGMADVYVAMDTLLNREVAVKVLRGELSSDPVALLRFQREAQASCALIHPNIVEIYDVGEDEGSHYIVMEYIRGKTLKQLIHLRGAIGIEEAVGMMKQLVSATYEAHKRGIIHRDIKPQNVLVKDDGTIKMVDFGIALAHDALQLTQNDSVMGSVHYLAPELAKGEQASYQSDIYALGIVFFELLSGQVPFTADQPVQVALKHIREEMPSIRSMIYDVPQSVENMILKACAKRKEHRYRSCLEMLQDLSTCLSSVRKDEERIVFAEVEEKSQGTLVMDSLKDTEKKTNISKSKPKKKGSAATTAGYTLLILALLVLSAAAIAAMLFLTNGFNSASKTASVPGCVSMSVKECETLVLEAGLQLNTSNITYELTDNIPEGEIIETIPAEGTVLEKGSHVRLKVSSGTYLVMNDYIGMNINQAKKEISNDYDNIRVLVTSEESDEPAGTVLRQELLEPQAKFAPGKSYDMRLVISQYTTLVIPHSVLNMNIDEARQMLENMGAQVILSRLDAPVVEEGQLSNVVYDVVVSVSPNTGTSYTQEEGAYITLYYY
ncbi:MAG: Stk1 family PASTA domain-containing Ser/Thr kinase [Erysipelotrichaceae bacterium]|nr:Stk1 family PASTA domain-containing Ser/Thr kinase [Erysipelotrichaceae bacterium]